MILILSKYMHQHKALSPMSNSLPILHVSSLLLQMEETTLQYVYHTCNSRVLFHQFNFRMAFKGVDFKLSKLGFSSLAISLYDAVQNLSSSALDLFLIGWRDEFRNELLNDPQGRLGRTYPSLAGRIPNNFLEPKALELYCCPLTSQANLSFTHNSSAWLVPGIPSTKELAPLCDNFFGWGPDILKYMANHVWEGQFVQQLIKVFFPMMR